MRRENSEDYLCQNICYIRKVRKMTQKEMADILGVGVSTLRKIERRAPNVRITGSILCRICNAFEISADVLIWTDLTQQETKAICRINTIN